MKLIAIACRECGAAACPGAPLKHLAYCPFKEESVDTCEHSNDDGKCAKCKQAALLALQTSVIRHMQVNGICVASCEGCAEILRRDREAKKMSDCDEGDVPYVNRACQICNLSEGGFAHAPQACPNCKVVWPENLIERSPHDGRPDPWRWPSAEEQRARLESLGVPVAAKEAIDHPAHYGGKDDPFETIKVLESWLPRLPLNAVQGALMFNVIKYLSRAGVKGDLLEDCEKAAWYLARLIENLEKKA